VPLSLACGVGLRRIAGFAPGKATAAAATIFALEYISGAVVIAFLLSRGMPLQTTYLWWTVTTYGPVVLLVLALFEPSFRRVAAWLPLLALFMAFCAISLWLKFYAGVSDAWQGLFSLVTFSLWIAAIGYVMQNKTASTPAPGRMAQAAARVAPSRIEKTA
jgi:hypothetical protein